jgi:hypothetical protein
MDYKNLMEELRKIAKPDMSDMYGWTSTYFTIDKRRSPEDNEDKEAKEVASLKRFMTMCFNRTTNFAKCDYCEFRFKCYTERGKSSDRQTK